MVARTNWKGFLKIAEVICPVALYTATSTADRVAFQTLNRATGHRVRRRYVDGQTGAEVPKDDQVKGYETGTEQHIVLEPEEVAAAIPESDKTLLVSAFISCRDIDTLYFDSPYFLTPADRQAREIYALIREGMRVKDVAALARTVLFRRVRTLLIRAHGDGLIATTLNFDYEVRSPGQAFVDLPDTKLKREMLELAEHIIETKKGEFDPAQFDDRYDAALADLVQAKLAGKKPEVRRPPSPDNVVDLMAALRQSAALSKAQNAGRPVKKAEKKSADGKKRRRAS